MPSPSAEGRAGSQPGAAEPAGLLAGSYILRRARSLLSHWWMVGTWAGLYRGRQRRPAKPGRSSVHGAERFSPGQPAALQAGPEIQCSGNTHDEAAAAGQQLLFRQVRRWIIPDHHTGPARLKRPLRRRNETPFTVFRARLLGWLCFVHFGDPRA